MSSPEQQSIPGLGDILAASIPAGTVPQSTETKAAARQSARVIAIEGPPGSGKTRRLAREALRLQAEAPAEKRVLMLAVSEQNRRRINHYLRLEADAVQADWKAVKVETFDQFFLDLLKRQHPGQAVTLLEDLPAQVVLQGILEDVLPEGHPLKHAAGHFSSAQTFFEAIRQLQLKGISASEVGPWPALGERLGLLSRVYGRFIEKTARNGLLTIPDILNQGTALAGDPAVLPTLRQRYAAILVDEAQELSARHWEFLKALDLPLFAAGTRQLSIRSFRGAEPGIFARLTEYFPQAEIVSLDTCQRGNAAALNLVHAWMPGGLREIATDESDSTIDKTVRFGWYADPAAEAQGIADYIAERKAAEPALQWRDFVVLLRSAAYKPHLMNAFIRQGIPVLLDGFPDDLIQQQHVLFDWLSVLAALETLDVPADFTDLERHVATSPLPFAEWEEAVAQANRHLGRWINALLVNESENAGFRESWGLLNRTHGEENHVFLLARLMDGRETSPGIQPLLAQLQGHYQALRNNTPLYEITQQAVLEQPAVYSEAQLENFLETLADVCKHYQDSSGRPLPLKLLLAIFPSLWPQEKTRDTADRVRLLSIHQAQGDEFPYVIIPFLAHEEFPQNRQRTELLPVEEQAALLDNQGIAWRFNNDEAEEQRLLATGITRAMREVLLTTHRTDEGKTVLPSAFYKSLLRHKRRLLNQEDSLYFHWSEAPNADEALRQAAGWVDFCPDEKISLNEQAVSTDFTHQSAWARLEKQEPEPLYDEAHYLQISASSIKLYMECPRKYFYKQTLRLPEGDTQAASLGLLIHGVMEIFNQRYAGKDYNWQNLRNLAEEMFVLQHDGDAFAQAGFPEFIRQQLAHMTPLGLQDLQTSLMQAIDDLEEKGYFAEYAGATAVEAELDLNDVKIDGIERTLFRGKIDAMIQRADGTWDIIDYKTYSPSKFDTGASSSHFLATLDQLPTGEMSHKARFQDKLHAKYPKDYQLPLYYLATRNNPKYAGKLNAVALQLLRPPFRDNGSIRLEIPAAAIEATAAQITSDINEHIVRPILSARELPVNPSRTQCGFCSYRIICPSRDTDPEEGSFAE